MITFSNFWSNNNIEPIVKMIGVIGHVESGSVKKCAKFVNFQKPLYNKHLSAKISFDTVENEESKVCDKSLTPYNDKTKIPFLRPRYR